MTPRHDPLPGRRPRHPVDVARAMFEREWAKRHRRRGPDRPRSPGGEPCPVTPDRPLDLSGGAAAALTADD